MLEPRRIFAAHLTVIAGIVLANVLIGIADAVGRHEVLGLSRLMRLEAEANLPAAFSAFALIACAVAATAVSARVDRADSDSSAWRLLALFFAFLALDEAAMIHELFNRVGEDLATTGVLIYLGVFFYIPLLALLAARLLPFWLRQDAALRTGLAVAGAVYISAAIGMELVENGLISQGYDRRGLLLRACFIFEECGEMLGVALFLRCFLLRYSRLGGGPLLRLEVSGANADRLPSPVPADRPDPTEAPPHPAHTDLESEPVPA